MHVFLFQWTVNGDNGTDGILAQRHVEGELRCQEGGFGIMSGLSMGTMGQMGILHRETHSKIGNATYTFAQI